jgi:hypothetical protein
MLQQVRFDRGWRPPVRRSVDLRVGTSNSREGAEGRALGWFRRSTVAIPTIQFRYQAKQVIRNGINRQLISLASPILFRISR